MNKLKARETLLLLGHSVIDQTGLVYINILQPISTYDKAVNE